MATRKKSNTRGKKSTARSKAKNEGVAPTLCAGNCAQNAKEFFSKLLSIYGNKHYILLLGASVGFVAGVAVDHLFIKG